MVLSRKDCGLFTCTNLWYLKSMFDISWERPSCLTGDHCLSVEFITVPSRSFWVSRCGWLIRSYLSWPHLDTFGHQIVWLDENDKILRLGWMCVWERVSNFIQPEKKILFFFWMAIKRKSKTMRLLQKQRCQDHGEPDCEIPNFRFMCNQNILLNSSENTAQAQFRDTFMGT